MPSSAKNTRQSLAPELLELLCCPQTHEPVRQVGDALVAGANRYRVSDGGLPLFAETLLSGDAQVQRDHYDRVADAYVTNLKYPHTIEYMRSLDDALLAQVDDADLGVVAEICCGRGELAHLLGDKIELGVGVDISPAMLTHAQADPASRHFHFLQGDATQLPLRDAVFDSVFMLGGVHHVRDRAALFGEVARVLKPGGAFYYREPVSDFVLWRALRSVIYRLSPALDHDTERPLLYEETVPVLEAAGLSSEHWSTHGFIGFCLFMNSDILVFNRAFRFLPKIRELTKLFADLDATLLRAPQLQRAGLQVVGVARKPV